MAASTVVSHPTTTPSNHNTPAPFESDGTYARFVCIDNTWFISLPPDFAALVSVGTDVTCEVETAAGRRYTRSGRVVRKRILYSGEARALCQINEYRAGRPADGRNSYHRLPDGRWGVRLHATASRSSRIGDTLNVAVTTRSGRLAHVSVLITNFIENAEGDRQAIAEIIDEDRSPVIRFDPHDGVTEPCPQCGTTSCDSGILGACRLSPENPPQRPDDLPAADAPREDNDTHVEPIGRAQDEAHWSRQIDRLNGHDIARRTPQQAHEADLRARYEDGGSKDLLGEPIPAPRKRRPRYRRTFADRWVLPDSADLR